MKNKATGIILFSSVILLLLAIFLSDNRQNYTDYCIDELEYSAIKNNRKIKELTDINIKFEGFPLFFDAANDTYFYSLIENSSISYNPKIELDDYKIAILKKEINNELISKNEKIKFLIYDNHYYHEYELVCTTLPLMSINYEGTEFFYDDQPMEMLIFDNRSKAEERLISSIGNVRLRGIFSAGLEKVGLRLTLLESDWYTHNNQDLLGLRFDEDWILYAGYNDNDKVRNVFTENLWNQSCAKNNDLEANTGTEYKYLELFINGDYYGLYALCYPVDGKQLNLKSSDAMYQPYMREFEDDITYENYDDVVSNMRLKYGNRYDILIDYYEELFRCYESGDAKGIKKLIDLSNAIDEFLFVNVIQGDENANATNIKNMKVAIKNNYGTYKCIYVPWDFDMSWGNSVNYESKNNTINYDDPPEKDVYHITSPVYMLMQLDDKETIDAYYKRYEKLRKNEWSDKKIVDMINDLETDIFDSGAYYREMERWPNGSYMDSGFNLEKFKSFVLARLHYCDEIIKK